MSATRRRPPSAAARCSCSGPETLRQLLQRRGLPLGGGGRPLWGRGFGRGHRGRRCWKTPGRRGHRGQRTPGRSGQRSSTLAASTRSMGRAGETATGGRECCRKNEFGVDTLHSNGSGVALRPCTNAHGIDGRPAIGEGLHLASRGWPGVNLPCALARCLPSPPHPHSPLLASPRSRRARLAGRRSVAGGRAQSPCPGGRPNDRGCENGHGRLRLSANLNATCAPSPEIEIWTMFALCSDQFWLLRGLLRPMPYSTN